jgi:hypothetical protein
MYIEPLATYVHAYICRSALADAVCPLTPSEYDETSEYDQRLEP